MTRTGSILAQLARKLRLPAASWGIIALIAAASLFGQQLYSRTPGAMFWSVLLVLTVVIGVVLMRRLATGLVTVPLAAAVVLAVAGLAAAVAAGLLTPAEVVHVPLFGSLGASLHANGRRKAMLWIAAIAAGDEVLQAILPYRTGAIADVMLNLVSAVAGYTLATGWPVKGPSAPSPREP